MEQTCGEVSARLPPLCRRAGLLKRASEPSCAPTVAEPKRPAQGRRRGLFGAAFVLCFQRSKFRSRGKARLTADQRGSGHKRRQPGPPGLDALTMSAMTGCRPEEPDGQARRRSIGTLEVLFAQDSRNIDSTARPLEHHPVVSSPKPIQIFLEAMEFLDALAIWNRIVGETFTIGNNLVSDLGRQLIEVTLCLLGEKNPERHPRLASRLARRPT